MSRSTADIARRLAENAEAVCRRYLGNGRREFRCGIFVGTSDTQFIFVLEEIRSFTSAMGGHG